ncbi:DUF4168 domain-containing protein [Parvibaculum sp.]|uniref:DUF4168 domain-containing protein n=1 Tax=Parvibaculum sp. TaxID=2024848 RepID=UPI0032983169
MRKKESNAHSTILGAVMLGFSFVAVAAPAMAGDRVAQAGQPAGSFSDEQLQAYANAAIQVQQINRAMEQASQNKSDPDEMQRMQQQAYADLERVIKSNGLTIEEYNAIGQAARTDEEVRNKVTAYFEQMQQPAR